MKLQSAPHPVVSQLPAGAESQRRAQRSTPGRSTHFDHLALDELRAYRNELAEEETRVSYWRRVLQARIDIVRETDGDQAVARPGARAGSRKRNQPNRAALHRVLAQERVNAGRTALVRIVPAEGLPPLPDLGELWQRDAVPGDDAGNTRLMSRLTAAEHELSEYRRSLHQRIDAATDELVARYHERPALAVRALPLSPPVRPRATGY